MAKTIKYGGGIGAAATAATAANATPTNMSSTTETDDLLSGMKSQMDDDLDDLPFN